MEATDERTSRGTHVPFSPRKMFLNKEKVRWTTHLAGRRARKQGLVT